MTPLDPVEECDERAAEEVSALNGRTDGCPHPRGGGDEENLRI